MKISVIGTGYLGATHAACMAELGHDVVGVDTDESKVVALQRGEVPFFEPGLEPLLRKHVELGDLAFTTDLRHAAAWADVHFVCVGTPQRPGGLAADTRYVEQAVEGLAPHLRPGSVVVGKSTVPVGTAARLRERLDQGLADGVHVDLVWNPEFLREGKAVADTLEPDRIVVGTEHPLGAGAPGVAVLREVYATALERATPFLVTSLETAELVKVAANSFLATKISFINAMSEVCEAVGGDVVELAAAIGHDARIGHRFLGAGLGFGGGCLPKDIRAFQARCTELGLSRSVSFLAEVDEINLRRRDRTVALAHEMLGGRVKDRRVAVLGAAFKPDSDDVRDSPALDVADQLYVRGGDVVVYDPQAAETARRRSPDLVYAESLGEACAGADLVMVLTEWREFQVMDPGVIGTRVRQRKIVDGRNVLDPTSWRSGGWEVRSLGRAG